MKIKTNNFNFNYNNNIIFENLNIEFTPNKIHGILGPNGCGKTTLLKSLIKLLKVDNNSIYLEKFDINKVEREFISKKIAYVEQSSNEIPRIKVYEYITLGRFLFDDFYDINNPIINKVITLLKIENLKDKFFTELSGGERQKVIIARALAQETKVIILDEPTANLDPLHQFEIMELLKNLVKKENLTIITTLHDINLAYYYCDEIVLIKDKFIKKGKTKELINQQNIKKFFSLNSTFLKDSNSEKYYIMLNPL